MPTKRSRQASKKERRKRRRSEEEQQSRKEKKLKRRLLPIWLRLIIIFALCFIALLAGAMVGYGFMGDGQPLDALKKETWQHIIDIVLKEE